MRPALHQTLIRTAAFISLLLLIVAAPGIVRAQSAPANSSAHAAKSSASADPRLIDLEGYNRILAASCTAIPPAPSRDSHRAPDEEAEADAPPSTSETLKSVIRSREPFLLTTDAISSYVHRD